MFVCRGARARTATSDPRHGLSSFERGPGCKATRLRRSGTSIWVTPDRDLSTEGEAGDVPTRAVEPRDEAAGDGVAHAHKDDRDRPRLPLEGNARVLFTRMMSGCEPTNSCASARIRLMSPPNQRRSIRMLRPSVQRKSASACVNAE
jgi:hypothetical protein